MRRVGGPLGRQAKGLMVQGQANIWPGDMAGRHVVHTKPLWGIEESSYVAWRRARGGETGTCGVEEGRWFDVRVV